MELASEITQVVSKLPNEERFTYRDQMIRSSISVPSNIAEGSSRDRRKDFKRFLRLSLGSNFELETQLLLSEQNKVIEDAHLITSFGFNEEVQKMLQTLIKK